MKKSILFFSLFALFTLSILFSCDNEEELPNDDKQEIIDDSKEGEEKESDGDDEIKEDENEQEEEDEDEQDEDSQDFSTQIIGTWARVIKELFYDDGTDHTTYYEKGDYKYYQFHPDGSGDEFWDDGAEYTFNWYIEGDILTIQFTGTREDKKEFTLICLTPDCWIGEEDGHTQIRRTTFQRIEGK